MRRWRATLETGYRQGLQPLFREAGTRPELVLQIWDADLDLVSTAWEMLPEQTCSGRDCIYARARLCFKARLLDANRQVLRHVARCASSPYRFREDDAEATKSAVGAVEVMYQQLAEALLADAALGAVPAPVQTAAQSRSHEQQPGPVLEW